MPRERCWGWAETCNGLQQFGRELGEARGWGRGSISGAGCEHLCLHFTLGWGGIARQAGQGKKTLGLFHFPTLGSSSPTLSFIPSTLSTPQFTATCLFSSTRTEMLSLAWSIAPIHEHGFPSTGPSCPEQSAFLPGLPVPELTVDHCKNNKDF